MNLDQYLSQTGIVISEKQRPAVLTLLQEQAAMERCSQGDGDTEFMKLLALQLFSLGNTEDTLAIWSAKSSSMDADGSLDIQLLCGAGLEPTRAFLMESSHADAPEALARIDQCMATRDFDGFTPADYLDEMKRYFTGQA